MRPQELADRIFSLDKAIRYVGVVSPGPKYELLESRMREGINSLTPQKTDDAFVETIPLFILGAAERLEKDLGSIQYSLIRYKTVTLAFFKTEEYIITMSVEPGILVKSLYERIRSALQSEQ